MDIGRLRHRVTIQSLSPSQDGTTGEITETWVTFATVWAWVRPASVREFVAAGIQESKITGAITIRYLAGVKQSMRVLHGERIYNVLGVLPDARSGVEWLTLPVSEVTYG